MRAALLAAAVLAALVAVAPAVADTNAQTVYVVNQSTTVSDAQIANDLPAFQYGVADLGRYWGVTATLVQDNAPPAGATTIRIIDSSDQAGVLGYHDFKGAPVAYVFAGTSAAFGVSWTSVFSHELDEMLVDPNTDRAAVGTNNRVWLVEVCDPVSDGTYTRAAADGTPVELSDFVTPAWYDGRGRLFDIRGAVRRAGRIGKDGYAYYWSGGAWKAA